MKLTQLEITGFKSFVDTTKFSFSKGLTGIVGPNGCGKSNICDAIHWVLGEQNPRRLRGDSMKDVIFKGTRKRTQHSYTEVSIIIENDKKILPIEYEDVKVTRKFYRDGESEFFINNNSCRLKDILNLFYDTGMGRRAYSLMEQTMIDDLLSSNDEDRRYLFEEAAGIMKYNQSRKSSESKLKSVKNDLLRLDDIIAEVKFQVNSLRHQVGKAKKFQNLKQKINKIQIQLAGIKFFENHKKLQKFQTESLESEKKLTELIKNLSKTTQTFNVKNEKLLNIEDKLKEEQKQLKEIEDKINNYEKKILLNRQQISNNKSVLAENLKRMEKIGIQNDSIKKILANDIETFTQSEEKLSQQKNFAQELESKQNPIKTQITDILNALNELEKKLNEFTFGKQDLINEKTENQSKHNFLSEQKFQLENKISEYKNKSEEISKLGQAIQNSDQQSKTELSNLLEQKSSIEKNIQELFELERKISEKIQERELQIKSFENEAKQLIEWENNLVGYEIGTKEIIEHFSDKNISTLGNQIEVEEKYTSLIEKALKSIIPSAVCPENIITSILELLEKENLNSNILIKKDYPPAQKNIKNINDAIPLQKIIKTNDAKINPKIFENIYLVSNRKIAQKLADQHSNSKTEMQFITNDSEVFSSFGVVKTNWQSHSTSGLLSRKKMIKTIQGEITKRNSEIEKLKAEMQAISSEKSEKSTELDIVAEKIDNLNNIIENEKQNQMQLSFQLENIQNLLNESKDNLVNVKNEIKEIEKRETEIQAKLKILPQKDNVSLLAEQQKLRNQLSTLRKGKNEIETKLHNTKIDIAKLEKDVYFFSENIKKNEENVNQNENLLKQLKGSVGPKKNEIKELEEKTKGIETKFRSQLQILNNSKARTIKTENQFHSLRTEIDKLKLSLHEFEFKKDIFMEDKNNIKLKIQETKLRTEHIQGDTFSRFHHDLTHDEAVDYLDINSTELNQEMIGQQKKLDNLGPINLAAIDDYETQKKRLQFLYEQKEDLVQSQENLQQAIKKLNATAEKMFLHTFHQIQQNFENLFKEIFDGGKGVLRLSDEKFPLTAKIDIYASPKGKRISNINLLSSGEKALTAIALLFAIYLVKPSPFCILDEIDAPLDDSNINRFLHLLNKFSKDTQFIIITHNKRTVEAVSYLYGITMEESGVSKVVSVSFS